MAQPSEILGNNFLINPKYIFHSAPLKWYTTIVFPDTKIDLLQKLLYAGKNLQFETQHIA